MEMVEKSLIRKNREMPVIDLVGLIIMAWNVYIKLTWLVKMASRNITLV